jgi:hypothetical protein
VWDRAPVVWNEVRGIVTCGIVHQWSGMRCEAMRVVPSPPSASTRSAARTCSAPTSSRITDVVCTQRKGHTVGGGGGGQGAKCGVRGMARGARGSEAQVKAAEFRVKALGLRVCGIGFRV